MYSAYKITDESRSKLLSKIQPQFNKVIAHHITYKFPDTVEPPAANIAEVYGIVRGENIEALAVAVVGKEKVFYRPDKKLFHITYSLIEGKAKPVDSNKLFGDIPIEFFDPILINIEPELLS